MVTNIMIIMIIFTNHHDNHHHGHLHHDHHDGGGDQNPIDQSSEMQIQPTKDELEDRPRIEVEYRNQNF